MKRLVSLSFVLSCLLFLSGCTSSLMQKAAFGNTFIPAAKIDQAQIIFMRPSTLATNAPAAVFDLKFDDNQLTEDKFVGIVEATTKIVYDTKPGFHMFMVTGENADFMRANLRSGKTYFVLVTPRFGWITPRFSLKPLHLNNLHYDKFEDWLASTAWYENTPSSIQWAADSQESMQSKKPEYLDKWNRKSDVEKDELTLKASDSYQDLNSEHER